MAERPRYSGIFEWISELFNMEDNQPEGSIMYRGLIEAEQYGREGVPVAPESLAFHGPSDATRWVKHQARGLRADLVGITTLNHDWVFDGGEVPGRYAVMLGVRMDFREIMTAPDLRAGVETTRAYYALGQIAQRLEDRIREAGYPAWAQHPRFSAQRHHSMLYLPHAIAAGMGRLGRNGLVITPTFGPCMRWAAVTTDLELVVDEPQSADVLEACESCLECRVHCDADAIPDEPTVVRGVRKFAILPMRCAHEFARTDGCSKCIAYCPEMSAYPEELRDVPPWTPEPGGYRPAHRGVP